MLPLPPIPPLNSRTKIGPESIYKFEPTEDEIKSEPVGGGGGISEFPFQIITVDTENVKIRYGTVMDIAPTGLATNVDVSGTDGTWTFYIDCTIDTDGLVTAAAISEGTSGKPSDTSTHAYKLIGTVVVGSGVITAVNQSLWFSQGFKACDRDVADPTTTPGTYSFYVD